MTVRYGLLPIHFESPRGRKASQSRADGPQVLLLRHLRQRRRRRDEEDAPFLFALLPSPSFVYGHPAGERRPLSLTLTHTLKLVVFLLTVQRILPPLSIFLFYYSSLNQSSLLLNRCTLLPSPTRALSTNEKKFVLVFARSGAFKSPCFRFVFVIFFPIFPFYVS